MALIHASCVEYFSKGILIIGSSGAGKSDLSLRLMDASGKLVSDDYVNVEAKNGKLIGSVVPNIEGMIEVRGVGLMKVGYIKKHPIDMVLDLCEFENIDRLPEKEFFEQDGITIPLYKFDGFSVSALAKINLLIKGL
ncbi:MAG: HPr kinase/phosphatase C-terminal domain-containing protein [Emcibacteraceae bacterium]|nr:HPr kinase/phosphatase C-terminal domain-containing protein [Emcibacteraceae bacterium]MDG1996430.1 HPr kinase/phosphatase C-terminal domain-containing protein [Emcibacteraceae bacterium]